MYMWEHNPLPRARSVPIPCPCPNKPPLAQLLHTRALGTAVAGGY